MRHFPNPLKILTRMLSHGSDAAACRVGLEPPRLDRSVPVLLAITMLASGITAQEMVPRSGPVLRIHAEGVFELRDNRPVRVGDTVVYRLRVSWNEVPAAVRLSPRAALEAPGFIVAGSSITHARTSRASALTGAGDPAGRTDYVYSLVPREAGVARVAPFVVRYHNGLTGREEELNVAGASITVAPAAAPVWRRTSTWVSLSVVIAAILGFLFFAARGKTAARRRAPSASGATAATGRAETPEAAAIAALRARCDGADGLQWMADAERLCVSWLCRRLGVANPDHVRFEAALDRYLDRQPALSLAARDGWTTLRELFHEARYGRVRREPHELHDVCGILKTCLVIEPRNADNKPSKGATP